MSDPGSQANKNATTSASPEVVVLPPEAVQEAARQNAPLTIAIASAHSGPLPPPAMLREYSEAIPGLGNTIVEEFRAETSHRRLTQRIGQFGAIGVAALSIACGTYLSIVLHSPLAALCVIGPVCGIVGTAQLLQLWLKP
jgi:hypothetical protein